MSEKEVLVPNIGDFKDVEVIEVLICLLYTSDAADE